MRALVISGGGSKGAFAGGVAQYLIEEEKNKYDLFLGTSTGSLMVSHLALGKIKELHQLYTSVNQNSIFNNNPFKIRKVNGHRVVSINHINTIWNFIRGRKTFGESKNLKKLIKKSISEYDYYRIRDSDTEVVVTVSNISLNQIEYKSIRDFSYHDFIDWVWASANYAPFMSILEKNHYEYADGGFGCIVPIKEAIARGATEIDVIILETKISLINRMPSKNPFSMLTNLFSFMLDQVEHYNVTIGKLEAKQNNACLHLYYTPTVLTTNTLVFNEKLMKKWWKQGFKFAKEQSKLKQNKMKGDCY